MIGRTRYPQVASQEACWLQGLVQKLQQWDVLDLLPFPLPSTISCRRGRTEDGHLLNKHGLA